MAITPDSIGHRGALAAFFAILIAPGRIVDLSIPRISNNSSLRPCVVCPGVKVGQIGKVAGLYTEIGRVGI